MKTVEDELVLEVVVIEEETDEEKLSEIAKRYHILNKKCDEVLEKIRQRKNRKVAKN